jgi:hypothetical protein
VILLPSSTYVVSNPTLAPYWREKRLRLNIESSWIYDSSAEAYPPDLYPGVWIRNIGESARATHCLVRADSGEIQNGPAPFEIGAALGGDARVLIVGQVPQLATLVYHPNVLFFTKYEVAEAFLVLDQNQRSGKKVDDSDKDFLEIWFPGWRNHLR